MTLSRFCASCGTPRVEGARFCGSCGLDIAAWEQDLASAAPEPAAPDDAAVPEAVPILASPAVADAPTGAGSAAPVSEAVPATGPSETSGPPPRASSTAAAPVVPVRPTPDVPIELVPPARRRGRVGVVVAVVALVSLAALAVVAAALVVPQLNRPPGSSFPPVAPDPGAIALTSPPPAQPAGLADPDTPAYQPGSGFTPDAVRVLTVTVLRLSLEQYRAATGSYPADLAALYPAYAPMGPGGTPMAAPPSSSDGYAYGASGSGYTLSVQLASGQSYATTNPTGP